MKWFINPYNACLAFIPRCGSTAFSRSIITQYYPELLSRLTDASFPVGVSEVKPQFICPFINYVSTEYRPIALIRDPIDRFKSGFNKASNGKSVDQLIEELTNKQNKSVNVHIRKQSDRISNIQNIILYKFPVGIEAAANELGLIQIPSQENESQINIKPELTSSQIDQLKEYYSEDLDLYSRAFVDYNKQNT